jgi:hypothetical protein
MERQSRPLSPEILSPLAIFGAISRHFREKRMRRFVREFAIAPDTRILDVGGTPEYWRLLPSPPRVTLLNMIRTRGEMSGAESWVAGDGRAMPFADQSFDIVFSNSVIEHVGDAESQRRFSNEVARVGRRYWVQTPNRRFPVEPHLYTPFIHWLPRSLQRKLVPRFNIWSALSRPSPDRRQFMIDHYLNDIRLLTAPELRDLFPNARLLRERFCGLTKSFVVTSQTESQPR